MGDFLQTFWHNTITSCQKQMEELILTWSIIGNSPGNQVEVLFPTHLLQFHDTIPCNKKKEYSLDRVDLVVYDEV